MNKLFEVKGYLSKFYTEYTKYVNLVTQFLLALLTFSFINYTTGFSKMLSNPIVTVALSLICTFLPMTITVLLATVVTLIQLYMFAPGIAIVVGAVFLFMYTWYFRFTPKRGLILLLVPITFSLKMPLVIPIVYGLIGTPICILPVTMGVVVYYMLHYVKTFGTLLGTAADTGMTGQISAFLQQVLLNHQMWNTIIAFAICLLLVYQLRRMAVDHSWEIAIIAGTLANLIVMALGNVMLDITLSYGSLLIGSVLSVIVAILVEFFVFSVDYSRTEYLQFEDDEYYYHVKAVPKVSIATPEKTVKRINERKETNEMSQTQKVSSEEPSYEDVEIERIIEEELKK